MYENIDPLTGETFKTNRSNQRFASRNNQIRYNNLQAQKDRNVKAKINQILEKNRSILKALIGEEAEVVENIEILEGAGFQFACMTHFLRRDEKQWFCTYDVAYSTDDKFNFNIIKL